MSYWDNGKKDGNYYNGFIGDIFGHITGGRGCLVREPQLVLDDGSSKGRCLQRLQSQHHGQLVVKCPAEQKCSRALLVLGMLQATPERQPTWCLGELPSAGCVTLHG